MSNATTICAVCNYINDGALGEPGHNIIAPFLKFDSLPDQWCCPECGANKEMFQSRSFQKLSLYELTCTTQPKDATACDASRWTRIKRPPRCRPTEIKNAH